MMTLYSQKDPAYKNKTIGNTKFTIDQFGCFACALATLFQAKTIEEVLNVPKAFDQRGNVFSNKVAEHFGGDAGPVSPTPPSGWCIAMTRDYAPSYPTHFFCFNPVTKEMIDTLDFPSVRKPLKYSISQYRPFYGVKLDFTREDLEKKAKIAELALGRKGLPSLRRSSLVRFLERVRKKLL